MKQPEWYVLDRQYIQTYVEYGNDADRIGAIGEVFPAIFFLVAALVSLTTMTRMVEEQRTQIGTLKALGYGKGSIASKYILSAAKKEYDELAAEIRKERNRLLLETDADMCIDT